jgi:hypothetical protein
MAHKKVVFLSLKKLVHGLVEIRSARSIESWLTYRRFSRTKKFLA